MYSHSVTYQRIKCWMNYIENIFVFYSKFWMICFKLKRCIGHTSGMVGPIDVKQKVSASVGYGVNFVTLTSPWLDLEFFNVWNSSISGSVGLINLKRRRSKSTGYCTLPFDKSHGHCLDISRTKDMLAYKMYDIHSYSKMRNLIYKRFSTHNIMLIKTFKFIWILYQAYIYLASDVHHVHFSNENLWCFERLVW